MKIQVSTTVSNPFAGKLQENAAQFKCEVLEAGLRSGTTSFISVTGEPEQLQALNDRILELLGTDETEFSDELDNVYFDKQKTEGGEK